MTESGIVATVATQRVGGWDLLLAGGQRSSASGCAIIHYVPPVEMVVSWAEYRHARWIENDKPPARDVKSRRLWLRQDARRWRNEATAPRVANPADPSARPVPVPGAPAIWLSTTLCRIDNRRWHDMITPDGLARGAYGRDHPVHDVAGAFCPDCRKAVETGPDGLPVPGSLRAFMELPPA